MPGLSGLFFFISLLGIPTEDSLMKKLAMLMAFAVAGFSFAVDKIQPTRTGPVSQYGQLMAGKNSSNKGQIYGACKGVSDGNEVVIQGMSLFWSMAIC